MKLRDFKIIIDSYVKSLQTHQNPNVVVEIKGSRIGGTPCVNVKSAGLGIDWDSGKFIISTEEKLFKKE